MRTTVRFWRWRSNPLKRGSDRVEACAVLASGLLLAVGAPAAGVATGLATTAHAPRPPAGWHQVSAVLVAKAPSAVVAGAGPQQVRATVRWHTAVGTTRTGEALVRPGSPAGSRTAIWLDRSGAARDNPVDPARTVAGAVAGGTLAASGTALVSSGGLAAVRWVLARRRSADLDREWERLGPRWRRHRT
jgi:hypothetical protein